MISHEKISLHIRDFGAIGDGTTFDSPAINAAIEACEGRGGGRVVVPAGTYHCGPIGLRSGVELHLEAGALIQFSRDFDDFPLCIAFWEGQRTVQCRSPLWGEGLRDVAVTGAGTFDGGGEAWRPVKKMKLTDSEWNELRARSGVVDEERGIWWPSETAMHGEARVRQMRESGAPPRIEDYVPARDFLRPNMVQLVECSGVVFDGPTFRNSPAWNVHLMLCENVNIRHCTILNPWFAQNGDGIDLESCRDVRVENCVLDVGDDAICLKSGKDAEGRRLGRACEDIHISNCRVLHGHGGVVVGSEMSGGVRRVRVDGCEFRGTDVGLRFKTCRGRGGTVEDIQIRDIKMAEILGAAISFDMFYQGTAWGEDDPVSARREPVSEETPIFRDVAIENVSCEGARIAIEMRGLPEMPIENISISNMNARAQWGVQLQDARDITLRDVQLEVENLPALRAHDVENLTLVNFAGSARPTAATSAVDSAINGHSRLSNGTT